MLISRKSPRTGQVNTMDLPITEEQILAYMEGTLLQDAFPNLNAEQREFFKTGYTQEDWDAIFPREDD